MALQMDYIKSRQHLMKGIITNRHENTANGVSLFMDSYL